MDDFREAGRDGPEVAFPPQRFGPDDGAEAPDRHSGHALRSTAADLGAALAAIALPDLFGHHPDPATAATRERFHRAVARGRRRDAVMALLAEPWGVWDTPANNSLSRAATAVARRFLRLHPERDRTDPAYAILSDREAAAAWHFEEETLERRGFPGMPAEDTW